MNRRAFLSDIGLGFTGLALGAKLHGDGLAGGRGGEPRGSPGPHFPPKAKSVIWVFLSGGVSQLESFDPKPALTKYAGKTFADTPFPDPLKSPLFARHSRDVVGGTRPYPKIFPLQVGFKKHGELGVELADWFAPLAGRADDLAFVRANALPFAARGKGVLEKEQEGLFEFANELNRLAAVEYPDDEQVRARIRSYELAYRMQRAVPEVLDLNRETAETKKLYGL